MIIDIIIFAAIAVFIAYKLHNVLGRKDFNHEDHLAKPSKTKKILSAVNQETAEAIEKEINDLPSNQEKIAETTLSTEVKATIDKIKSIDRNFTIVSFTDGAKKAFEWILQSYANGNVEDLKPLTSPEVLSVFTAQIDARNQSNETLDNTLIAILSCDILEAALDKSKAIITVKFVSEQVNIIRDTEGNIISGNPSDIEKNEDIWVLTRNLKSSNPNWLLTSIENLDADTV